MPVPPGWADVGGGHIKLNLEGHAKEHGCSSVCRAEAVTLFEQENDMMWSVSE